MPRLKILTPAEAAPRARTLDELTRALVACEANTRLRRWSTTVAKVRRLAYRGEEYWGRPVPGFGDPKARLLVVGLAPAAHGGNRTGRVFTGDRSGDFLYASLHRQGLGSQAESTHKGDGLRLRGVYIAAAVRCAPPANKPTPAEFATCLPWLAREVELLPELRAVLVLGKLAHDAWLAVLAGRGARLRKVDVPFSHGAHFEVPGQPAIFCSYHVSQQNTFTGKLTPAMLDAVVAAAKRRAGL